ncbi:SPOC like C-terminal domain-containing protein [Thamnocephalis sphaerospora]|uniref:ATP-dependent DNA helicase II subunit 1 n=1 Tax=Thamnocephalis sphaerospora TaxID=78915 RepID=A0A4P9XQE7_9FUNG|nr:SPOC like C-terminal domain-containing protein [Thamnocephalis sphaerospora]|eukprot:RKP08255.1 SPOC like C-terminal domain-containing protein [Thamnocephalis sphaerospora]
MAEPWSFNYDEEEEEEAALADERQAEQPVKNGILFVIDASTAMREPGKQGESPLHCALRCAGTVLLNKLVSSEEDLVGVLLYGTTKQHNSSDFRHIYLLQDLDVTDVPRVLALEDLKTYPDKLEHLVGAPVDDVALGDVLWMCHNVPQKLGAKRIFMITSNDNPNGASLALQRAAKTRAKDLRDLGIRIELFPFDPPGQHFDFERFYKSVMLENLCGDRKKIQGKDDESKDESNEEEEEKEEEDELAWQEMAVSTRYEELLTRVRRREMKKRIRARLPLDLSDNLRIGVRMYNLVLERKKPKYELVYMRGETTRVAKPKIELVAAMSNTPVNRKDVQYYFNFGGVKVQFTAEEMAEMKDLGDPGIRILGFKPRSVLKRHHNVTHVFFLYPDETAYEGSTAVFTALLEVLASKEKVAIARYIGRKHTGPRLVALIPQLEITGQDGQVVPPGLHMVILPFSDDIRHIPVDQAPQPLEEEVDLAKKIIGSLTMKNGFQPENYENPVLRKHHEFLQAIALERESVETLHDSTLPKTDTIARRIGKLAVQFKEMTGLPTDSEATSVYSTATQHKKRKTGEQVMDDTEETDRRKVMRSEISHSTVAEMAAQGQLNKLTRDQLRAFLNSIGIRSASSAKKAELLEAVQSHLFTS